MIMAYFTWRERLTIPDYSDPEYARAGRVTIDHDRCDGCGLCVQICPGSCLYLEEAGEGKKAYMMERPVPDCMSCNDCAAVCERDAVTADYGYDFSLRYKAVRKGDMEPPRNF